MTTKIKAENALDQFVQSARELFESKLDVNERWTALSPIFAKLLDDPAVLMAARHWPKCVPSEGRPTNLLFYEDSDYGFVVNGLVKEGRVSKGSIHDQGHSYTLYGVLDGHERVIRYERLDDRSRPDYAEIREIEDREVGPGEIDLRRPYEMHTQVNNGERFVAIVIRSQRSGTFDQGRYEPESNRFYASLGPHQIPCEMFKG